MSKKLIFGILITCLVVIIGLIFGISTIIKFNRMQKIVSEVVEDVLKDNYYLRTETTYGGTTSVTETFYRDGIGKLKSENGLYTWSDGENAYLINEEAKEFKKIDINNDVQLLVTNIRLASLYPTISNNVFERFFVMGNIENKIKTVEEDGKEFIYIELNTKNYTKSYWLDKSTNVLTKSKLELSNGEVYEFKYEIKYHFTKLTDIELPNLDEYKMMEDLSEENEKEQNDNNLVEIQNTVEK